MSLTIDLTDGNTFVLTDASGHTVEVPATLSGLVFLKSTLAARKSYAAEPPLGVDARPTQAMVKAFLASHSVEKAPTALTAAQIEARNKRHEEIMAKALEKALPYSHLDLELDL